MSVADVTTEFAVRGVDSEADARAIGERLDEFRGVQMVDVDEGSGRVEVRYGEELHSEEELRSAVEDAGYDVE